MLVRAPNPTNVWEEAIQIGEVKLNIHKFIETSIIYSKSFSCMNGFAFYFGNYCFLVLESTIYRLHAQFKN